MTALAKDASNYSVGFSPDLLAGWKAAGIRLVILQCFPPGYAQYAIQRRQIEVCAAVGMLWDAYIYDYLGDMTWRDLALMGLDAAAADGLVPRKVWLDQEDVTAGIAWWTPAQRVAAIGASLDAADAWLTAHSRPPAGIYSAAWWWGPRTGNTTAFADRQWWIAEYDGIADASVFTPFVGVGDVRLKQYAGTQNDGTDLDVLSATEEAELTQPADDPRDQRISDLLTTLGVMGGDVADSLSNTGAVLHKQATAKRMTRAQIAGSAANVDNVVNELRRLRAAAS